jgi:hypothetical protein
MVVHTNACHSTSQDMFSILYICFSHVSKGACKCSNFRNGNSKLLWLYSDQQHKNLHMPLHIVEIYRITVDCLNNIMCNLLNIHTSAAHLVT